MYCDENISSFVCLLVHLHTYLARPKTSPNFYVAYGYSSNPQSSSSGILIHYVLTYSFMDDVMFSYMGPMVV